MNDEPPRTDSLALLIVDVQNEAVALGPYRSNEVLENIARLIEACRRAGVEVVHVQHDDGPGSALEAGSSGWEIHSTVRPAPGEKVVHKRHNSAFRDTDLRSYLRERGIRTLILVGIQTEYCVDTTCRVAFEHGFEVVMPEMTNTTYDNGELTAAQVHAYHNRRIFEGRFATMPSMPEALEAIEASGAARAQRPAGA
jgi:nicotinamidase-related amidase